MSNIKNKEILLKQKNEEIKDTDIIKIIESEIKQIKDSISYLEKANKEDEIKKENLKISIIEKYLPKKMSKDELREIISNIIKENNIKEINKWKK